jgi:hypothetical protein
MKNTERIKQAPQNSAVVSHRKLTVITDHILQMDAKKSTSASDITRNQNIVNQVRCESSTQNGSCLSGILTFSSLIAMSTVRKETPAQFAASARNISGA